jgi:hypothetical protein
MHFSLSGSMPFLSFVVSCDYRPYCCRRRHHLVNSLCVNLFDCLISCSSLPPAALYNVWIIWCLQWWLLQVFWLATSLAAILAAIWRFVVLATFAYTLLIMTSYTLNWIASKSPVSPVRICYLDPLYRSWHVARLWPRAANTSTYLQTWKWLHASPFPFLHSWNPS